MGFKSLSTVHSGAKTDADGGSEDAWAVNVSELQGERRMGAVVAKAAELLGRWRHGRCDLMVQCSM